MSLGPLQDEFRKHTQEAAQIVALRENAINMGLKGDALVAGVIDNSAAATKEAQGSISEMAEKQAKQQADDALFMAMVNDLNRDLQGLKDRSRELDASMDDEWERLVGIYGSDADEKFYEQVFGKDGSDLALEERLDALQAEMVGDDGTVKAQYADHPLANFIEMRAEKSEIDVTISAIEVHLRDGEFDQARNRLDTFDATGLAVAGEIEGSIILREEAKLARDRAHSGLLDENETASDLSSVFDFSASAELAEEAEVKTDIESSVSVENHFTL